MESIYYYHSNLPRTVSGMQYLAPRCNPMEEAYRYALRILEQSFSREMEMLYTYGYNGSDDYYRRKHEIESYYYSQRERLEYDFTRISQQYYYGYSRYQEQINILKFSMYPPQTYLLPKETTKVPTETKKWIIISSEGPNSNPKTHTTLADAEKEAQRLARKFPAQEFTIYETKKAYKIAEKPVDVKHFI